MPEQLRSLIYIVLLALIAFFFAKKITASIVSEQQFNRWRNTWIALTFIAFLAGNFWVYAILCALLLWYVGKREQNAIAMFFVLLFALPRISNQIPGMGIVNFLFNIDYVSILSFTVLLPAYLSLRSERETAPFLTYWADKLLLAYMLLDVALLMRDTTVTDAMRAGVSNFTDIFLPYYVASRGIKTLQQFKEVMAAFVIAAMVAAMHAMFEYSRFWLLYVNLKNYLGVAWEMGGYLGRGDSLRALASLGQPIALGYIMVIALGSYLFISHFVKEKWLKILGLLLILGGLYAPLSRGPWIGALLLVILYIVISPKAIKRLTIMAVSAAMIIPIIASMPIGKKVMDMLPFVGKVDAENVDYRVRLLDAAYTVFNRYPFFGSVKYREELAELGMVQGEGIVDVVNTYLDVVLEYGLVGFVLYMGFFTIIIATIITGIKKIKNKQSDIHLLGRVLFANQIAILVTITSVSSILVIPVVYWAVAGLAFSFLRIAQGFVVIKEDINALPTIRLANNSS
ncbi:MAG TPA: O-antigen ligase family protein [Methylotenera sp.]|nr:O-antigen ligase family protein [Methylotenera sp.]HPH06346.1 O-antigen ligase family protein [Methylotenera sp.]HPN00835.1 O-antigen ligase family protein [Methylotenera sp.]